MSGEPSRPGTGIALIVAAASCFALMDTTISWIGSFIGVAVVLWLRYAIHAVIMAGWLLVAPGKGFRTANPRFQILRGSLLLLSSAMAFTALRQLPVAEFTAIVMLTPLLVTDRKSVV